MERINKVEQVTHNKFVNLYNLDVTHKNGRQSKYFVASRAKEESALKLRTGKVNADGVVIYALYGEKHDRVVLIRQYRYPAGDYVYELPAGLVDEGENFHEAAVRELKEETGLTFHPLNVDPMYEKPAFTTVGLTDEACGTVYGYADGEVSDKFMEASEDIQIILADRDQVRQIMKEGKIAIICQYQLMHFLANEEKPFRFLGVED